MRHTRSAIPRNPLRRRCARLITAVLFAVGVLAPDTSDELIQRAPQWTTPVQQTASEALAFGSTVGDDDVVALGPVFARDLATRADLAPRVRLWSDSHSGGCSDIA